MEDKCVCCGDHVPEGRQVCSDCETGRTNKVKRKRNINKVQVHADICNALNGIYERKNHDYGDSFAKLRNEIPNAILVRIYDKYSRLKTLMQGAEQKVNDESIDDTLMDLANYCILELIERRLQNDKG